VGHVDDFALGERARHDGRNLAAGWSMSARKTLDQRPGPLPDIHLDGDSVTFTFDFADPLHAQLVVRCDPDGEVYAALPQRQQQRPHPFTDD
jgi:hypothetical protein